MAGVEEGSQFGVVGEQTGHVHEQVVEVDGVCRQKKLLIHGPELGCDLVGRPAPAGLERRGRKQVVLGPADRRSQAIDRRVSE